MKRPSRLGILGLASILSIATTAAGQEFLTAAFTYQGRLLDQGAPANGAYDIEFALYDQLSEGNLVGGPIAKDFVEVVDGVFTVELDFGLLQFPFARFLEISVRPAGTPMEFTLLEPRQKLTVTPYALSTPGITLSINGNVGIGTESPEAKLDVSDNSSFATILGRTTEGRGVQGSAAGGIGVFGQSDARGIVGTLGAIGCGGTFGVGGCATTQIGVLGRSDSFRGVQGESPTGIGVFGNSTTRGVVGTLGPVSCPGTYGAGGCSADQIGVLGSSETGIGMVARTTSGAIFVGQAPLGTNRARIDATGKGFFDGGTQSGGADFAESMPVHTGVDGLEPGDVLVIDTAHPGAVAEAHTSNSHLVAGVYSTAPSLLSIGRHHIDDPLDGEVPVAIVGIVPTKVSAENGPIQTGDLLTTASTPGHAMKASPIIIDGAEIYATGTILGKALAPLAGNAGVIDVLVQLK